MIDFACKQFKLDDVVKCGFGLAKADYALLRYLIENNTDWFTTEQLAKSLNLNVTTIQRAVKKMYEKGLLLRSQHNLRGGGYIFIYHIKEKEQIRRLIAEIVKNWASKVETEIHRW